MSPYADAGLALVMDARMAEDAAPPSRARLGGVGIFCASFDPPFAAHRIDREAHRGRAVAATGRSVAMGSATGNKCDNCKERFCDDRPSIDLRFYTEFPHTHAGVSSVNTR